MEDNILDVYNEDNKLEKIEVLKFFSLKNNNKDYIIYKPINNNNNDKLIFSAQIKEDRDSITLLPIKEKEIELLMKDIAEKLLKEEVKNE